MTTNTPSRYGDVHHDRRNLLVHALTVPVFMAGTVAALAAAPLASWALAASGLLAMAIAIGLQGASHKREARTFEPFRGPLDFARRIFVEQWITFPRFVATGGFAHEWRGQR